MREHSIIQLNDSEIMIPMSSQGPKQGPKQQLFAQFALVAKTLGHPHRLELLEQLAQGERSVDVLAEKTGLSVANASQHLQRMLAAGIVANRRDGKLVIYRLADDAVLDGLAAMRRIAEKNVAEVGRVARSYFDQRDSFEPVTRKELLKRSRAGAVTILDVRPAGRIRARPPAGCSEHSPARARGAAFRA